ncbi:MAG TPA: DUF1501 domain-containing protein [Caldilineaceae bacterium]|nr:DUF1501 domain-containing protein [Caldilineaceae bacterium]
MFEISRRGFMVGCSAAIAAMVGGRISYVAFGSADAEPNQEILVTVFLRGGMDGLSAVFPIDGPDRGFYETSRENIAIPLTGDSAALPLSSLFGMHSAGAPLLPLYQAQKLAIVHAAGLTSDTRSHFDAMQYMELGTPDSKSATSGWLTRHLESAGNLPPEIIMPAMAAGNLSPTSLAGSKEAIGMTSPGSFSLNQHWYYGPWMRRTLRDMYAGDTWLHAAGQKTLNAVDVVELGKPGQYTPANGAEYPGGSFGDNLKAIAQIIKMQLGLRVATVDLGGWDTHEYQCDNGSGYFNQRFGELARGLAAFYTDLTGAGPTDHTSRLTIVVMSEFGRTFKQNASRGTDHGHGNVIIVLGGNVKGGQVFGQWPGLNTDQLYDKRDLQVTTDYRQVLSEILIRRMANPHLGHIFPSYRSYQPLNLVAGADLTPIFEPVDPNVTPTPTLTPPPGSTATPTPPGNTIPPLNERTLLPLVSK